MVSDGGRIQASLPEWRGRGRVTLEPVGLGDASLAYAGGGPQPPGAFVTGPGRVHPGGIGSGAWAGRTGTSGSGGALQRTSLGLAHGCTSSVPSTRIRP